MFLQKKRYYLDSAASTPVVREVLQAMQPYWRDCFANPNSIHQSGRRAKQVVKQCEQRIKQLCNMGHDDQVVWTSGGTESNHLAIDYVIDQWKKDNPDQPYTIVISSIEHPSVVDYLESKNDPLLQLQYIPVTQSGEIDLNYVGARLSKWQNVILVSCIFQSSEVGTTQPIKQLRNKVEELRDKSQNRPLVHVDASQGMMYYKCNFTDWGVDLVTLCGQKIHGPKGVGVLLVKKDVEAKPLHREGTPAVPQNVGITKAFELAQQNTNEKRQRIMELRSLLFEQLNSLDVDFRINCIPTEYSLVINLSFNHDSRDSEQLVVAFDQAGLEVSSKSACMGSQAEDSRVLSAMGLYPTNSIRLCLHHSMKEKDIKEIAKRISNIISRRQ